MDEQSEQYFEQDRAPSNTARAALQWLMDPFDERMFSRNMMYRWASHSPDLTPLDVQLLEYRKNQMCGNNLHTLQQLRADVRTIPLH